MPCTDLRRSITALSALLVATAACEPGPTTPGTDHAQFVTAFVGLASTAGTSTDGETFTAPCPAGGQFVIEGTTTRQRDGEVSIVRWDKAIRYEGCSMTRNGVMARADGQMASAGEARFGEAVDQHAPLLFQLSTQTGSMTTVVNGTTRTCSYDLRHEFDAGSGSYRITGTACGRAIDMRAPATP
ncbi:MAG TPA: hypothetical protein VFZ24_06150 [Longimicrobiales bacterium]